MDAGVYRRYQLTEEVQLRTVWSKRGKVDRKSINISELMAMVMAAYVMIVVTVLMGGDSSSAVKWVINCKGGGRKR